MKSLLIQFKACHPLVGRTAAGQVQRGTEGTAPCQAVIRADLNNSDEFLTDVPRSTVTSLRNSQMSFLNFFEIYL